MTKVDFRAVLDGRGDGFVPVWFNYIADETREKYGEKMDSLLADYPSDFIPLTQEVHKWGVSAAHAEGGVGALADEIPLETWDDLEGFIEERMQPIAETLVLTDDAQRQLDAHDGRPVLGHWWYGYSENVALLRGPLNAFMDVLLEPDAVNRLFDFLDGYFISLVDRYVSQYGVDAVWIGDDYGMQDRSMYSPELFGSLIGPRLRNLADAVHARGLKLMLHSCGNIKALLPPIIEAGVDFVHPLQPGTMDQAKIVEEYGRDIGFFGGIDVQKVLVEGSPAEVDNHVRALIDTYRKSPRGALITMGNTLMPETPWENIEAAFRALRQYSRES